MVTRHDKEHSAFGVADEWTKPRNVTEVRHRRLPEGRQGREVLGKIAKNVAQREALHHTAAADEIWRFALPIDARDSLSKRNWSQRFESKIESRCIVFRDPNLHSPWRSSQTWRSWRPLERPSQRSQRRRAALSREQCGLRGAMRDCDRPLLRSNDCGSATLLGAVGFAALLAAAGILAARAGRRLGFAAALGLETLAASSAGFG